MMKRFGTTTRIAFAMAMWSAAVLLTLRLLGVLHDGDRQQIQQRTRLCEVVAVSCSQFASRADIDGITVALESLVARNENVLSAACRDHASRQTISAGDHAAHWNEHSRSTRVSVNVYDGSDVWGQVEVAFRPVVSNGLLAVFELPSFQVIGLAVLLNAAGFCVMMRRCFRQLDPTQAVPERVRTALNTMSELVLVLDDQHRVMLANDALTCLLGRESDQLQGDHIASLPWYVCQPTTTDRRSENDCQPTKVDDKQILVDLLIKKPLEDGESVPVQMMVNDQLKTLKPNASPIRDPDGNSKGVLLSLDDISVLAARTEELQQSRNEIKQQNEQLRYLATRDPLTGCLNRRSFFEHFEGIWHDRFSSSNRIACLMTDIDHFKSINDEFGHAVGDEVLRQVSETLRQLAREQDLVCRFGGEEFCIVLPDVNRQSALEIAESLREGVESLSIPQRQITISLGCAIANESVISCQELIERADEALYQAKNGGRNRVVAYDRPGQEVEAIRCPESSYLGTPIR